MKAKIIIFIAIASAVTLSFTYVSSNVKAKKSSTKEKPSVTSINNEPIGGFSAEDKL